MADDKGKDKRFEVSLALVVQEVKDGEPTAFFDNTLRYHDIGYDGVVAVEQVLMEALGQLSDAGVVQAMELGLGDRLQALGVAGIGDKVAAMAAKAS